MSAHPAQTAPNFFGMGWTAANPSFSATLRPLCLTYLTYIYIYYIGNSTAERAATTAKKIAVLDGQGWAAAKIAAISETNPEFFCPLPLGSGQPLPLGGWA